MPAPSPDEPRHKFTLRIPDALYWRLMQVMTRLRRTNLNAQLLELIERFVEEHEQRERRDPPAGGSP